MEYIYAALLLHKLGQDVNEDNVKKVVAAAGTEADEAKIKSLIASLKDVDIEKELESASLASVSAPSGTSDTSASDGEDEEEEEKEEEKKEAAAEGLGALFG